MEMDIEAKEMTNKLQVSFYFFVIKTEVILKENFKSNYFNDKIIVHCFMSGGRASEFYQLCVGSGLRRGIDFVDGLNDGPFGLDYFENDWLKFEEIDGRHWVYYKESEV